MRPTASMMSTSDSGIVSSSSLPASIFEKSRMSSRIRNNENDDSLMVSVMRNCEVLSWVLRSKSIVPIMPFIGVRISWLMVARKVDLASLAFSAVSLAVSNASVRSLMRVSTSCFKVLMFCSETVSASSDCSILRKSWLI